MSPSTHTRIGAEERQVKMMLSVPVTDRPGSEQHANVLMDSVCQRTVCIFSRTRPEDFRLEQICDAICPHCSL